MNKKSFISVVLAIIIVIFGVFGYFTFGRKSPRPSPTPLAPPAALEYQNDRYGFSFTLPESWKGYSIVAGNWQSNPGDAKVEEGPALSIRHPQWTSQNPRQDIPVMIFTLSQWNSLLRDEFHIGAAPVNPARLGYNANYVFALPARYNYAFLTGWEEVENILQGNPLHPLLSFSQPDDDGQILLCGGIPNGSTQSIAETTRLFINLPKDIFPDKEHNLQFKTTKGNATAGWISNAGPYGEAFQANQDCWSYYYEFDGLGEIDLTAKNAKGGNDYFARFVVRPAE